MEELSSGALVRYSLLTALAKLGSARALAIFGSNIDSICCQFVNMVKMCIRCGCSGLEPPLWVLYSVMKVMHSSLVLKRGTPLGNWDVASSLWGCIYCIEIVRKCICKAQSVDIWRFNLDEREEHKLDI